MGGAHRATRSRLDDGGTMTPEARAAATQRDERASQGSGRSRVNDYAAFLASKRREWTGAGISAGELPASLFPFQSALTRWALKKGRAALWADTGLGKTRMQLAWADQVPGRVLILAPLC